MAQDTPSRELEKIIVRLPDGMRDRLRAAADANKRSVNAEVVARLEESLGPDSEDIKDGANVEALRRDVQLLLKKLDSLKKERQPSKK